MCVFVCGVVHVYNVCVCVCMPVCVCVCLCVCVALVHAFVKSSKKCKSKLICEFDISVFVLFIVLEHQKRVFLCRCVYVVRHHVRHIMSGGKIFFFWQI